MNFRTSYSKLSCFDQECERMYWYKYENQIIPKGKEGPLIFGSAIHKAIDEMFRGKGLDEMLKTFERETEGRDCDEKRTLSSGKNILTRYYKEYREQHFDEILEIEKKHSIEIVPTGENCDKIIFTGVVDKIIRWPYGVSGIDHKTTTGYLGQFLNGADTSYQFTGYIALLKDLYSDTWGMIVDAIYVPRLLKPAKDGTPRFQDVGLERSLVTKSHWAIEEWKQWVRGVVERILSSEVRLKRRGSCYHWNRECPYMELCDMEWEDDENLIEFAKNSVNYIVEEPENLGKEELV